MKITKKKLAEAIIAELGACMIPLHCFDKPIKPLNKSGSAYIESYRGINKRHREQRKWFLESVDKILKRLENK